MRRIFLIVFMVFMVTSVLACSSTKVMKKVDPPNYLSEKELFSKVEAEIKSTYNPQEIVFSDAYNNDKNGFAKFYFSDLEEAYEGIAYYSHDEVEWKKQQLEVNKLDINRDFTISIIVGETNDDLKRRYYVASGYINNTKIKEIRLIFSDDNIYVYKIGEGQRTYMDVKIGYSEKIKQIAAFDKDSKIISSREW